MPFKAIKNTIPATTPIGEYFSGNGQFFLQQRPLKLAPPRGEFATLRRYFAVHYSQQVGNEKISFLHVGIPGTILPVFFLSTGSIRRIFCGE